MDETGKTIQHLRKKAGFTQKDLAKALNITDKAVSKWERGICLPDTALLPKLSLLLDMDLNFLVSASLEENDWVGFISIWDCDLSQRIYDKPLVYYILSHYLLLGIKDIYVLTDKRNQAYLDSSQYKQFGFHFYFTSPKDKNVMFIRHPWFLFGSDLTQLFQGAMLSGRTIRLKPENQEAVFYFIPKGKSALLEKISGLDRRCSVRTLGRGMIAFDMGDFDKTIDVALFIRTYQTNSGMLIGCLEEIAYRQGILTEEELIKLEDQLPYGEMLKKLRVNHKSVATSMDTEDNIE